MSLQQISTPPQSLAEQVVNRNMETLEHQAVYGQRQSAHSGLTWAYYGGRWGGTSVADGTVSLTGSNTNYLVVNRSTAALTSSTATTNWNDSTNYARVYKITTGVSAVTAVEDHRAGPNGVHGGGGTSGATELRGLLFTSDTDSTTDADPGAGLFKWNNATQGSATKLFIDNATADGVTITTFLASLGSGSTVYMQQADDATRWQLWQLGALTADSGYYDVPVTLQAKSTADIQDAKSVYFDFSRVAAGNPVEHIIIACSDESTALTTGTAKVTFRMPYAFTLTDVRASVTTAPTGGTLLTVDVNESGASILSTKLTFDASAKTTTTAATPRVISDSALADDAEITIDIDAIGSTIAGAGLKVTLIGTRA